MSIMPRLPLPIKRHPAAKPKPRPRPRPADSWPAWTDAERWYAVEPAEVEPDPLALAVDPADEMYHLGFRLGLEGEHAGPANPADAYSFTCGRMAGFMESPDGVAWQDDLRHWRDVPARVNTMTDQDVYPAGCPG